MQLAVQKYFLKQIDEIRDKIFRITKRILVSKEEAEFAFQQFQTQMKNISIHLNNGVQKISYLDYWNNSTEKLLK